MPWVALVNISNKRWDIVIKEKYIKITKDLNLDKFSFLKNKKYTKKPISKEKNMEWLMPLWPNKWSYGTPK